MLEVGFILPQTNRVNSLHHLLDHNKRWAEKTAREHPGFFEELARQQSPEILWIGCSDSRVPANQITGLAPGEVFVHRNIANVVVHSDLNCLSVIQFAVDVLKVKHIIVTGHYGCSGVRAALESERHGLVDNWLRHIGDVHEKHRVRVRDGTPEERLNHLCELNVIEQVLNLSRTTIVKDAWERGQPLHLHGWIYGIRDGLLRDLGVGLDGSKNVEDVVEAARHRLLG